MKKGFVIMYLIVVVLVVIGVANIILGEWLRALSSAIYVYICLKVITTLKHSINLERELAELSRKEMVSKEINEDVDNLEKAAEHFVYGAILYDNVYVGKPTEKDCIECFIGGAKWKEQQLMAKAVDATVHIDAGGYPYIPQMELYDYKKDIPLAKEGDKYKVILIKEG